MIVDTEAQPRGPTEPALLRPLGAEAPSEVPMHVIPKSKSTFYGSPSGSSWGLEAGIGIRAWALGWW